MSAPFLDREPLDCQAGFQPVDGAARGAVRASVHRPGLCLQRLQPADDQADRHHASRRPDDWKLTDLGWIFTIAIFVLGCLGGAARALGRGRRAAQGDVHRRRCASAAASWSRRSASMCTTSGSSISATACSAASASGIGYISPVSTLIKWFPDRPGMATGMAIMGFGGARLHRLAAVGLADGQFSTPTHVGVAETFVVLGVIYFCFMMVGACDRARAGARLEARGLCRAGAAEEADHQRATSMSTRR